MDILGYTGRWGGAPAAFWGSGSPRWGDGDVRSCRCLLAREGSESPVGFGDRSHGERRPGAVPAGLCSAACLLRHPHCDSPLLLRAGSLGKNKPLPSKKVTQQLSQTTTRSLGDLKVCRGTRGLVARFLQRPKRSRAPSVELPGHSAQGHKQVSSGSRGAPGDRASSSYPGSPIHTLPTPH